MPTPNHLKRPTKAAASAQDDSGSSRNPIQVIDRMMKLLDVLSYYPEPVSLKLLAQETGLHPSTAHRILSSMAASGFVERGEPGAYGLGIRLLTLGNLVKSRINIRETALPLMQRLHQQTGESVNLGIRQDDEIVYVERTSSGRSAVRIVHIVGARAPLHNTATGKLFLASDGPAATREYARRTGLSGITPNSITELGALEKELDRVRRHGVAYDIDEIEIGVRCIAAGIRDDSGDMVAGLSLSSPSDRFNQEWTPLVKQTADEISSLLGYRQPKK